MSGKSDLLYLKEWAFYLKNRQFRNLSVVLTHRPANRQELAFLLEIVSQLFILRSIQASLIAVLQRPALLVLTQALHEHSVGDILCIQSVNRLLSLHQQMQTQQLINENNQNMQAFVAEILAQVSGYGVQISKNETIDQLKMIGKWGILLKSSGNFKYEEVLAQLKCWWTVSKLMHRQTNQDFKDLLMIWYMHNQERSMEMLIQSQKSHQKEENYLMQWFNYFYDVAIKRMKQKDIEPTIVENISKQIKLLAKICQLKNNKNKKQILCRIKQGILARFKGIEITQQLAVIFSIKFCLLQIISKQSDVDFSTLLTIQDLISNQHIFYSSLWTLQSMDMLHYFTTFTTYMKNNSSMSILLIYRKIFNQIKQPNKTSIIDIQDAMINKKTSILFQFNYKPLELTEYLLQYYLNTSNISMPHNQKTKRRRTARQFLKPLVYDPLHFLMVKEDYWNDSFHRDILQISLWICLDCYSKWLQQIKIKETTDKQLNEYLKKLNLSLVIFLLSLNFPTKMLQYFPIESDAIKQIIIQPIFPTIILENKFFFQTYKQKSDTIETKQVRGLQHWILPWSHVLAQPKTITNFIHSNRGYELAYTMLTHNKTVVDKNYSQFIVFRITTELQSMGINMMGIQSQNKLKVTFLDADRRKYMIALLRESQKTNQAAKRLLQLLI